MEKAIGVERLTKTFKETSALKGISFEIGKGELFGILGPDGAGKTTLCRILAGLMKPTEGSVTVGPFDVAKESERLKHHTGYMPHNYGLYGDLSVEENIDFYADIFRVSKTERRERMDRILGFTGMAPFKSRRSQFLSGGMKQKLQLACALIHTPEYLILDEPTYGVDPVSRREFWKLLLELLRGGLTIMVSTSYMDEAQRCNRVALLHKGEILHQGHPDDIIARIPGIMLEMFSQFSIEEARALESYPWIRKVTLYGDRVHILLREQVDKSTAIEELKKAGHPADTINVIAPSLEDSFILLVEEVESHEH
jgi:ABC-2 type transport system ATP-binding protein